MRPLSGKRVGSMQCKVIGIRLRKFSTKICLRSLQASHRLLLSLQLPHFLDLPDKHKHKDYSERLNPTPRPLAVVHTLKTSSRCAYVTRFAARQILAFFSIRLIPQIKLLQNALAACARLSLFCRISFCAPVIVGLDPTIFARLYFQQKLKFWEKK